MSLIINLNIMINNYNAKNNFTLNIIKNNITLYYNIYNVINNNYYNIKLQDTVIT